LFYQYKNIIKSFCAFVIFVIVSACDTKSSEVIVNTTERFVKPRNIVVSFTPFQTMEEALENADSINWHTQTEEAKAITLAYASQELIKHLNLLNIEVGIISPSEVNSGNNIILAINGDDITKKIKDSKNINYDNLGEQGYIIDSLQSNLYITAKTRIGVLYGVYGFLEHIGFNWYDDKSTTKPKTWDDSKQWAGITSIPRSNLRGFWLYGSVELSESYTIWLARNKLNLAANIPSHLKNMLGFKEWGGEHNLLQQEFSKEGLFEQHPEWFATVNGVKRPVVPNGTYFNPSFANEEAANYFSERMIERLTIGDLQHVDILNVWPADSRTNRFDQSDSALAIGNETDNLFNLYRVLTKRLKKAYQDQKINREVTLAGISYYTTWKAPTNLSIISELEQSNYLHIFYLNERSWSGVMNENLENRSKNKVIVGNLAKWQTNTNLNFGVVEYYNYSVYAAVALTDYLYLSENYNFLNEVNNELNAYMHPLLGNPGPRRLTNKLSASLSWENSDQTPIEKNDEITADYFLNRYGQFSEEWKNIYEIMSNSVDNAKEMFAHNSLYWLLLKSVIWSEPNVLADLDIINSYKVGGVQELPIIFSSDVEIASFRGLDESIRMQLSAQDLWLSILAKQIPEKTRKNMDDDVLWFQATLTRYQLMAATSDYVVARLLGEETRKIKIQENIDFLMASPTTKDTISPVNQRAFLKQHQALINN